MRRFALIAPTVAIIVGLIAGPAIAGKPTGGGGGGKSKTPPATGSFTLVLKDSTDGLAHHGGTYTFNVTSTATYNFVRSDCYQGADWVYEETNGFYSGWLWDTDYVFNSSGWASGAADCTATLYYTDSSFNNPKTLSTMSFHVNA